MTGAVTAIESAASQTFPWLSPVWRVPSGHTAYLIHSFSSLSSKQPGFTLSHSHQKPRSSVWRLHALGSSGPCRVETSRHHSPCPLATGATVCEEASRTTKCRGRQQSLVLPGRLKDKAFGTWEAPDGNGLRCLQHPNGQLSSALLYFNILGMKVRASCAIWG